MKKILIISEWIAPTQNIASIRWSKISYFLKNSHDVEIAVLTNKKNYCDIDSPFPLCRKDILLEKSFERFDHYYEFDFSNTYCFFFKIEKLIKKLSSIFPFLNKKKSSFEPNNRSYEKKGIKKIVYSFKSDIHFFLRQVKDYYISRQCIKFVNKNLDFSDFDVVISTYSPLWTHIVASHIKSKSKCRWIADFRDPYITALSGMLSFYLNKNKVEKICQYADFITLVNDDIDLYLNNKSRLITISNGYDPEEMVFPVSPQKFSFVFTGVLYNGLRDFSAVFKAVNELIYEEIINSSDVEFHVAGPDNDVFLGQAKQYDLIENVICHGVIDRKESLKLQQNAAILLQGNWNIKSSKTGWSGKMYEYMMSRKPIIYTVTGDVPNSFPSFYMCKLGGICYEYNRHDEMFSSLKDYIKKVYLEWKTTGNVKIVYDKDYVLQYSYDVISEKIWSLLE